MSAPLWRSSVRFGGVFGGSLIMLVVGLVVVITIAAPAAAGAPPREQHKIHKDGHPGCHGIANAYSHHLANRATDPQAAQGLNDLRAVADRKGCDLSGVEPADRPKGDDAGDEGGRDDGEGGPPANVVADKCEHISDKLAVAKDRAQGNSADAFARQADKWSCSAT